VPLTIIGPNKTGGSGFKNWIAQFSLFGTRASGSCLIRVLTHFGDSAGESTTSRHSSLKKGCSGINGSDLDKNNIIKRTLDILTEEDRKALEAYRIEVDERDRKNLLILMSIIILLLLALLILLKPSLKQVAHR
jgi:hypothetical protein